MQIPNSRAVAAVVQYSCMCECARGRREARAAVAGGTVGWGCCLLKPFTMCKRVPRIHDTFTYELRKALKEWNWPTEDPCALGRGLGTNDYTLY